MSDDAQTPAEEDHPTLGWKTSILVSLLVVGAGVGLIYWIYSTQPTAERTDAAKTTAMLVDVTSADTGTYRPRIEVMGTVVPSREVVLRPRVSGKVVDRSENFTPGGFVQRGDTVVRLDPSDYENTLRQRQSELRQARSDLEIEMGRQDVAREEYQLFEEELSDQNRALVLREPQLQSARAAVESARSAVDQARLELVRTRIHAPFDARVLDRNVNVGSQVSAGDNLARLVGMDTYWVETTVPLSSLRWMSFPDTPGAPAPRVRVEDRSAWADGEHRTGRLYKLIGEVEDQARMARVLVSVDDPLLRDEVGSDSPSLILGSFVQTRIQGEKIRNVVRLDREYLREQDTVWVMADGELDIRDVTVVYRDAGYAYVREGLSRGDRIVTTNLSTVVDGAALRLKEDPSSDTTNTSSEPST